MDDLLMENITQVLADAEMLYSEHQVEVALDKLATSITEDLSEKNPLLLCVMVGAVVTGGKLATRLNFPLQVDYVHATRYRGKTKGGELTWRAKSSIEVKDRDVLVIDDIFDEGVTLKIIHETLLNEGAKSVQSVALVNKLHDRKVDYLPKYIGLDVPDRYVFGYGMDYKNYLRNAAGIYAVDGM
jgi:hypoxanthine phosphoribosyltransferase